MTKAIKAYYFFKKNIFFFKVLRLQNAIQKLILIAAKEHVFPSIKFVTKSSIVRLGKTNQRKIAVKTNAP